jgi:NAD(P)-dependent dehydrogenase (short-subunit alcohol dehydrogenase family)
LARVANKVAIVTGAASRAGLGYAIARALAREGASVVLTDIDGVAIAEREKELRASGWPAVGMAHDVSHEAAWHEVIACAVSTFGRLDILVNNAGIAGRRSPIHEMTLQSWKQVLDVNLTGAFLGCKHAIAVMLRQGTGGAIVNVASISALLGFSSSAAYGSSKGGMRQLSKVIAVEGAKAKIRCNTVFPGPTATDMFTQMGRDAPERVAALVASIPLGRLGLADDIANCVLFLASDEASYVTGAEIVADGGVSSQ